LRFSYRVLQWKKKQSYHNHDTGQKNIFKCKLLQCWFIDKASYSLIKKFPVVTKLSEEHNGRNTNLDYFNLSKMPCTIVPNTTAIFALCYSLLFWNNRCFGVCMKPEIKEKALKLTCIVSTAQFELRQSLCTVLQFLPQRTENVWSYKECLWSFGTESLCRCSLLLHITPTDIGCGVRFQTENTEESQVWNPTENQLSLSSCKYLHMFELLRQSHFKEMVGSRKKDDLGTHFPLCFFKEIIL
jgi:hypothetical protein